MTREQAIEVLKNRYYSSVTRSRTDDEWRLATDTAIVALREKQQRESGCVYCNGETPIADTMDSLQRGSMLIVGGKRLVVDMPTDYISEEICYCPMCGKRLEVWHDAD